MTTTKTKLVSIEQLRRTVALVLAKHAQKMRKRLRKFGHSSRWEQELDLRNIRWSVEDILSPKGEDGRQDSCHWYTIHQELTDARYRGALKFWEQKDKVRTRQHGRAGNGYRWVLLCEKNEERRRKAKRKLQEAQRAADDAANKIKTAKTQKVADRLSDWLSVGEGKPKLTVWNNNITITRKQAEDILSLLRH